MTEQEDKELNISSNSLEDVTIQTQSIFFAGPMPHPAILEGYNNIEDGLAREIIEMAKKEQNHRHNIDNSNLELQKEQVNLYKKEQRNDLIISLLGSTYGLIIAVLTIGGSLYLTLNNHPWVASFLGIGGLGSIVTVFVTGNKKNKDNNFSDE